MDAEARYQHAEGLAAEPSEAAARELVAMLADLGSFDVDSGGGVYETTTTTYYVYEAARASLAKMPALAWPPIIEALPSAADQATADMLYVLEQVPAEARATWPDASHAVVVAGYERLAHADNLAAAKWERDFARRAHAGEFATPEAFWRARVEGHPSRARRAQALRTLITCVPDRAAFAAELVVWLDHPDAWLRRAAVAALGELPPVLPADTVRLLAGSDYPRDNPLLMPVLARHGEPAAALIPRCLEILQPPPGWVSPTIDANARWKLAADTLALLGDAAASARPTLVTWLLAIDEQMSIQGSLRLRILDALGDPKRTAAELGPRVAAMAASGRPMDQRRAADLQRMLTVRSAG